MKATTKTTTNTKERITCVRADKGKFYITWTRTTETETEIEVTPAEAARAARQINRELKGQRQQKKDSPQ